MTRTRSTQVFWRRLSRLAGWTLVAKAIVDMLTHYAAHALDVFPSHRRQRPARGGNEEGGNG